MQETKFNITANEQVRKGIFSNLTMLKTTEEVALIDFIFIDNSKEEDGVQIQEGVIQSRVVVTLDTLEQLKQNLDAFFDKSNESK